MAGEEAMRLPVSKFHFSEPSAAFRAYKLLSHDPKHTGSVEGGDPPTIVQSPVSATVNAGESVTFSVVATGTEPLSYQWRKDGQILSGEDGTDLTLSNVTEQDEGDYDVVVVNVLGQAVSAAATLTVNSGGGK